MTTSSTLVMFLRTKFNRLAVFRYALLLILPFFQPGLWAQKAMPVSSAKEFPPTLPPLNAPFWDTVPFAAFTQSEPNQGTEATERTRLMVSSDDKALCVLVRCYQAADTIVARNTTRDSLVKTDDAIIVVFDTYHDGRSGFGFSVNPLGTMSDFRIADDGRTTDANWDAEWSTTVVADQTGWAARIVIPFASLKYGRDNTVWGFNVGRIIRYNAETAWWSGPTSGDYRISQAGQLTDLHAPARHIGITFFPYATLRADQSQRPGAKTGFTSKFGTDLRLQFNTNLQANLTYQPDFSTVETDRQQVNLTRYELSYPEKRLFFQEGNEIFNTRIQTFYSRRIGDIDYGGKLTGKTSGSTFNLLTAHSPAGLEANGSGAWFTALRIKNDILRASTIGLTVVDKTWESGYARSLSADYDLSLANDWKLTGQIVGSAPGDLQSHSAAYVRFARENNIYKYHLRLTDIGEDFMDNINPTGLVTDDDRREADSDFSYRFWMKNASSIKYISVVTKNNVFWSHTDALRGWHQRNQARIYLRNRFSLDLEHSREFRLFEERFHNHYDSVNLGYNTDEASSASVQYMTGQIENKDFQRISGSVKTKLTPKLSLEYSADYIDYQPDPKNAGTFINIVAANYNFTKDLWFRILAQDNTTQEKTYFYAQLGWRFKPPFGAVYLVFNGDDHYYPTENKRFRSDIFFLKVTYPIGL